MQIIENLIFCILKFFKCSTMRFEVFQRKLMAALNKKALFEQLSSVLDANLLPCSPEGVLFLGLYTLTKKKGYQFNNNCL